MLETVSTMTRLDRLSDVISTSAGVVISRLFYAIVQPSIILSSLPDSFIFDTDYYLTQSSLLCGCLVLSKDFHVE